MSKIITPLRAEPVTENGYELLFPVSDANGERVCTCYDSKTAALLIAMSEDAKRLALKAATSLANNLCPDHRDKQGGKPCLACEIERLRKLLKSHGQHKAWCKLSEHIDAECDCGIKAALAAGGAGGAGQ